MADNIIQVRFSKSEEEKILKRVKGNFKNRSMYHKNCFQKFTSSEKLFELDLVEAQRMSYNSEEILDRRFNVVFSTEEEMERVKTLAKRCSLQPATLLRYMTLVDLKEYLNDDSTENKIIDKVKILGEEDKEKVLGFIIELLHSR